MVKQGDIIKLNDSPNVGHKQGGYRPAVVVSSDIFNKHTNMTVLCPIISTIRDNPFHVRITENDNVAGDVLCEQVKAVDLNKRQYRVIGQLCEDDLFEVLDILKGILG